MIRDLSDATLVRISRAVVAFGVLAVLLAVLGYILEDKTDLLSEDLPEPIMTILVGSAITWVAFPRQPRNRALWVIVGSVFFMGMAGYGTAMAVLGGGVTRAEMFSGAITYIPAEANLVTAIGVQMTSALWAPGLMLVLTLGILIFPDGELPSRRWRWVAFLSVAAIAGVALGYAWENRPWLDVPWESDVDEPSEFIGTMFFLLMISSVLSVAGLVTRYFRSDGEVRRQIRWVLWGFVVFVVTTFFLFNVNPALSVVGLVAMGSTYAIAITKYRLYDVDILISRTVLYGLLAAFIGGVYAFVVVGIGTWVGAGASNLGLSLAATALVAVVFEPVRVRVQRFANRVVYGTRATPYQVLSDLTARLASAESTEGLLERMVRRLAEGTGAARAALHLDGDERAAAVWPPDADHAPSLDGEVVVPIVGGERALGSISVAKPRGESLTPTERALLEDLAGSAAMVLSKVRLDADLRARADELSASRRRLVDAQGEERRHLERDLHDGAQQQIVALKVKLGLAARFAEQEGSEDLKKLITQMADDAQEAIYEIRSLAKGIFPPLLEGEGLKAALTAGAANAPVPVVIDAPDLTRHAPDVEAAAYFCISEAITNAVKHAAADRIEVSLESDSRGLEFSIVDDGEGFDMDTFGDGSGIVGMRDRIEALGGSLTVASAAGEGTTVSGYIPD